MTDRDPFASHREALKAQEREHRAIRQAEKRWRRKVWMEAYIPIIQHALPFVLIYLIMVALVIYAILHS